MSKAKTKVVKKKTAAVKAPVKSAQPKKLTPEQQKSRERYNEYMKRYMKAVRAKTPKGKRSPLSAINKLLGKKKPGPVPKE